MEDLLEVKDLCLCYREIRGGTVKAVDGVSFSIAPASTYGLVGESGSGKSTIGRAIVRLLTPAFGEILYHGRRISGRIDKERRQMVHRGIQMVFQDPIASLNPRKKVLDIVAQGLDDNHLCADGRERERRVCSMLERVGLLPSHAHCYPHQFSGGQRQRIGIARALIMEPDLLIADEAVSALDVSVQAQILNLLRSIQKETGTAILFIDHNLSAVRFMADQVGVLHRGRLVETGPAEAVFARPSHPYTQTLLSCALYPDPRLERKRRRKPQDPCCQVEAETGKDG